MRNRDLTMRESETLWLCSQGYTYPDIARQQHYSLSTIQCRMEYIKAKLGASTKLEAVLMWMARGRWT
jgi:DNA-binding NarL/FixJ family response regulator